MKVVYTDLLDYVTLLFCCGGDFKFWFWVYGIVQFTLSTSLIGGSLSHEVCF